MLIDKTRDSMSVATARLRIHLGRTMFGASCNGRRGFVSRLGGSEDCGQTRLSFDEVKLLMALEEVKTGRTAPGQAGLGGDGRVRALLPQAHRGVASADDGAKCACFRAHLTLAQIAASNNLPFFTIAHLIKASVCIPPTCIGCS